MLSLALQPPRLSFILAKSVFATVRKPARMVLPKPVTLPDSLETSYSPEPSSTAFIFANGDANDGTAVQRELLQPGDRWVIAVDGGARCARQFNEPIHVLIGDLDSLDALEVETLTQNGTAIYRYPAEKDETDLELALRYAASLGFRRIRIFSAIGDRIDQTLSNITLLSLPALREVDVRLVSKNQTVWFAYPGETTFEGAVGDTVSLLPANGKVAHITTSNLQYALQDNDLDWGTSRGISNVMTSDTASVSFTEGVLLIVHTLGRA